MVSDPYKVLEISRDADKDEIKKAYRRMAKKYHPDLHPDDPKAAEKMNEINEAYDMLCNPEKYQQRRQQESRQSGYGGYSQSGYGQGSYGGYTNQQGSYGNSGNYGGYNGQQQNGYGGYGSQQGGYGGFYGSFGDFEDFFGFGRSYGEPPRPSVEPQDASDIRQAIDFINMKQYAYASQTLNTVVSGRRNARWFYLSALANNGQGNSILASEQIKKAVEMEPNNQIYRQTLQWLRRTENAYTENGAGYQSYNMDLSQMCLSFCALQFFCTFCRCC